MPTIVLHIYEDDQQDNRIEFALALARSLDAHISCVHAQLVNIPIPPDFAAGGVQADVMLEVQRDAAVHRAEVEAKLAREDVAWDWQEAEGNVASCLIKAAQFADAIVVSQDAVATGGTSPVLSIVNDLVGRAPVAVFVVPTEFDRFEPCDPVVVAWNGSEEAASALRRSLLFLRKAASVHVVEIGREETSLPSLEAVQFLARHGVMAEIHHRTAPEKNVADEILRAVHSLRAAYVVMGAYGHSPLREKLLGGVTQEMLNQATIPLLLTH